ncbi:uncharacterized protein LOC105176659 [Sesamum indicum]|uniref:Uncharacterized protein LOC105176659 n=1 Tax=Sesamum indicum TaxID=4182 RepID=A0A6I9USR4_SESIN|nr:uncharacterized protein LOC105176659 [Sesamum indicum]
MSSSMASSIIFGHKSTALIPTKPYARTQQQVLCWNPISTLGMISKCRVDENCSWGDKTRVMSDNKMKRNRLFVVYANSVPGAPLPSGPPPSKSMSWILGFVVSFILPFFTNKWGPLWVIKNRIDTAVQTVENMVEAVEKVAGEVDKIAEDIADDLPQGKLKDLVDFVEDMAEKTAKTADSLDNIIDKVQEAEDQVEHIVECAVKEATTSSKK